MAIEGRQRYGLRLGRKDTPEVSCARCGRPCHPVDLTEQDGFLRCPECRFSLGEEDIQRLMFEVPDTAPVRKTWRGTQLG